MKGKLALQINSILHDLNTQNQQIRQTMKSLTKVKSQQTLRLKAFNCSERSIKKKKAKKCQQIKQRKSKTIHRCSSCRLATNNNNNKENILTKETCLKSKEKGTMPSNKSKTLSIIDTQKKPVLRKERSPIKKSAITNKYMAVLKIYKPKKL